MIWVEPYDIEPINALSVDVKAAWEYERKRQFAPDETEPESIRKAFKAGAEWQKEQMMEDAVEGEVVKDISNKLAVTAKINLVGFKFGQKVKIIIIKDDETIND